MKNKKSLKKKKFSLAKEYIGCFNYILESKIFIYFSIGIFFFFLLLGFLIPVPEEIYGEIIKFIQELLKETENMSMFEIISFIISNNVQSTFFSILFGAILGIYPVISAIANGYLLGFVAYLSVSAEGALSLWRVLPHGVFELPAVFISLGLGLRTGSFIFQKEKIKSLVYFLINSLKVFLLIILPLLIIAGFIEGILIFFS